MKKKGEAAEGERKGEKVGGTGWRGGRGRGGSQDWQMARSRDADSLFSAQFVVFLILIIFFFLGKIVLSWSHSPACRPDVCERALVSALAI